MSRQTLRRRFLVLFALAAGVCVLGAGSAVGKPAAFGGTRTLMAVPVAGGPSPLLWLKADAITGLADGASVASWPDSSGGGNNATQSDATKQPVFRTSVVNGLPVVRFNGTSSVLTTALSAAQKPVSIVVLVNFSTKMTSGGTLVGASASGGLQMQLALPTDPTKAAGSLGLVKQQIAAILYASADIPLGAHVVSATYGPTGEARLFLDGSLLASGLNDQTLAASLLWIGGNGSNSEFFSRDIGELLVYNSVLADVDRESVEGYLRTKWATPAPTYAGPISNGPVPSMWLKADAIGGLSDGGSVASWPDSSGHGYTATQTDALKRPVFKAGVANGLPVVRFNGTSSVLTTALSAAQKPVSVVALVNYSTSMTSPGTIVGASTNGGLQLAQGAAANPANGGGILAVNKQQLSLLISTSPEVPMGTHIVTFTYTGNGQARLYLDGRLLASGRKDSVFDATNLWIGGNGSNGEYFSRDIGEILVYNSALANADRDAVEAYVRTRWATPAAPTTPPDPVMSPDGLRDWRKADAISGVANGGAVATWPDSSGVGGSTNASSPAPTYQTDVVAGLPTVRFGAGKFISTNVPSDLRPLTLFAVVYLRAFSSAAASVVAGTNSGGLQLQLTPPSAGRGVTALNSKQVITIGAGKRPVPLGAHLLGATYASDGTWQMFVDGELVGSGVKNVSLYGGYLQLADGANFEPYTQDIGEFVVYDNVLADTDRKAIERYLMEKWGTFNVPVGLTRGDCNASISLDAMNPSACLGGSNSATGAYTTSATDASLAGVGVPFAFTRTYNSNDSSSGRLGTGWADNLGASLVVYADQVVYSSDSGQQIEFMTQTDGSFRPLGSSLVTLTSVAGGYEVVRTDQTRLRFDTAGKLTSIKDRNGQGLSLAYDGSGRLSTATDSGGRQVTFISNADGTVASLTMPDNRKVTYGYTSGKLTTVVDMGSGTWTYAYDAGGLLASITDPNNHLVVRNTFTGGRLTDQTDALNNKTTYAWNTATQTQTVTDARGNLWKDIYRNNVLVQSIDPLGNATSNFYDALTLDKVRVTDARGYTTATTYDARHNMLTRTAPAPLSYQESWTYNTFNDLLTQVDARGNQTSYAYDAAGNMTTKTQPGNVVTTYTRDPAGTGLLTALTDPLGKTTTFGYDAAKNLTSVTQPLGEKATMGYDSAGRKTSSVDPRGNVAGGVPANYTTSFVYDNLDRKTSETNPLGNKTQWAYDPVGNLLSTTNASNQTTSYVYNAADRLTSVTAPGTATTSYVYDANGNRTQRTDPNNHITTYSYDAANRLIGTSDPLNRAWSYAYDASGNKTQTTSPGNGVTSYTYDQLNRLSSVGYSDTTPAITYTYDANGNRTQMADGGNQSYTYDALNRLIGLSRGANSFSYAYDAAGNISSRTYPGGTQTSYTYDDDRRLATVVTGAQTTTYAYDAAGNPVSTTLPAGNGYAETRAYDTAGRLTQLKNAKAATVLSQYDYLYDPLGKATQVTKSDGTLETYTYDNRGRLTGVCYQASCPNAADPYIRWTHDPVGNRLTEVRPTGTTSYTYDAADQLTQSTGPGATTAYTYDGRGNQTAAGSRTFTFNLADRETATTDAGVTSSYGYDGDGNRLSLTSGATTINYLWDPNNAMAQLAVERDGAGSPLRTYIRGLNTLAMVEGANTHYYHYDRIGSVTGMTSSTGQTEWAYTYEPFGTARTTSKVDPNAPVNPLRFLGQYEDPPSKLVNLRARQYDTTTGRFLGTDPKPAGPTDPYESSYNYAGQDPINSYDLDGNVTVPCVGHARSYDCAQGSPLPAALILAGAPLAVLAPAAVSAVVLRVTVAATVRTVGISGSVGATKVVRDVATAYRQMTPNLSVKEKAIATAAIVARPAAVKAAKIVTAAVNSWRHGRRYGD